MTFISTRRTAATIAAAICMAIPATAQADSDAAQLPGARTEAAATPTYPQADFRGGDNPADHPGMSRAPQQDSIVGDDIASHPGMPGAPKYDPPTTIEVVRPERTIVRDVDEALPIALAGSALLLVLATLGITLVRMRLVPRPGRSS